MSAVILPAAHTQGKSPHEQRISDVIEDTAVIPVSKKPGGIPVLLKLFALQANVCGCSIPRFPRPVGCDVRLM